MSATYLLAWQQRGQRRFNPRARDERDVRELGSGLSRLVSIHALVMSATRSARGFSVLNSSFNPRARDERDRLISLRCATFRCFNPRARDERDGRGYGANWRLASFNPRARDERDLPVALVPFQHRQFQSTRS